MQEDFLEEIVELDPLDGEALMLLGQHYTDGQDLEQAEFYYERAQNIEEYEVGASIRLAQLLVLREKYTEAVPLLRRAQELEPREDVAGYLEQVEKLSRAR
jgi:Flp pilus assembly protein TadD